MSRYLSASIFAMVNSIEFLPSILPVVTRRVYPFLFTLDKQKLFISLSYGHDNLVSGLTVWDASEV